METVDPLAKSEKGDLADADVETTVSGMRPQSTVCGLLKQSCLLFPATATSFSPSLRDKDARSQIVTSTIVSPPDSPASQIVPTATPPSVPQTDTPTGMEVGEHGDAIDGNTKPPNNTSTSKTTLARLRKTKQERDALRLQREKLRAEALALREAEKLRREEEKLKREIEKKAHREHRVQEERARAEKREEKGREKRERQERREAERLRKEAEEQRKREEKRKFELEKQHSAEERIRKQLKEQELFAGFFSKLPPKSAAKSKSTSATRCSLSFDKSLLDELIQCQVSNSTYLFECQGRQLRGSQSRRREKDDVIIMSSPTPPPKTRMKLLQFHNNVRPAYFGSWKKKKSGIISGRCPFKMDTSVLDYEFDSDDEWEEEEPGESVSSAGEGDDDSGEESAEEGDEDGFFVPHGYLSEDEGERSESEGGIGGREMDKVKAKAKAWEAEFQRTCQPKKEFSALVLVETPVRAEPIITTTTPLENQGTSATESLKRPVPEGAMPDLIRLVHHSTVGLMKLIKTFQTHWATVVRSKAGASSATPACHDRRSSSVSSEASPQVVILKEGEGSGISKRQLERKIQQIAVKEIRPPSAKNMWYVHESVLKQYNMDSSKLLVPLLPQANQNSTEYSSHPEAPFSTPVGHKRGTKRKTGGTTPSVKTLFEAIARSPPIITPTHNQKRLKLTPSPAAGVGKSASAVEPTKKRIRLESLSLNSPPPPVVGATSGSSSPSPAPPCASVGEVRSEDVIVIDDNSFSSALQLEKQSSSDSAGHYQPTLTPSRRIPLETTPFRNGSCVQSPVITTPAPATENSDLKKAGDQMMTVTECLQRLANQHVTTGGRGEIGQNLQEQHAMVVTAEGEGGGGGGRKNMTSTKCLQELTNQHASTGDKGGGGGRVEKKQHIDWQKLNDSTLSNSTKVTVIAEIH